MDITDIRTVPIEIPVKPLGDGLGVAPYVTGSHLRGTPEALGFEAALDRIDDGVDVGRKLLIRLELEDGTIGWGEIEVPSMRLGRVLIEELVAPELIGRAVWEVEDFVETFEWFPSGYYRDILPYLGAVEIAMWDAFGKHLGRPVHQFLGGKRRDSVPLSFCLGLLTPEASRPYARLALDQGFEVLKTKASRYWQSDVERLTAMHDEVDGQLEFRLDPNQIWSFDQAVRAGAQLEDAGVYLQYLEQPIRIDSFGSMAKLRERLRQPIAVNEDAYMPRNVYHLGREAAIDTAVIDLIPSGGITGFKRDAAVAREMGIAVAHHSNFDLGIKNAAKAHVMATTPGCDLPMDSIYYAFADHLLETPLEVEAGRMVVPDEPGLAGPVDESKLETYRVD